MTTSIEFQSSQVRQAITRLPLTTQWRGYIGALIVHDVIMIWLVLTITFVIRFGLQLTIFNTVGPNYPNFYRWLPYAVLPLLIVLFWANGLYKKRFLLGGTEEYARVFRACTTGVIAILVGEFLLDGFVLARGWLVLLWVLSFLVVSFGRFWFRRGVYALRRRGYFMAPALLIGANDEGRSLAEQFTEWVTSGLHIVGFVDDDLPVGQNVFNQWRTLGNTTDLDNLIATHDIKEIVVATSALPRDRIVDLFKRYGMLPDINMHLSSGLFELMTTDLSVKEFVAVPLVRVNKVKLTGFSQAIKTLLDVTVGLVGLIVAIPIFVIAGLAIKFSSPGPIIYRRRVVGLNGHQFDAFKFRTMVVNGDEVLAKHPELQKELAENHKLKNDPRITKIGNILRKTSLDELPQLLNVIKRDMSIVGPRMITPAEIEKYGQWGMNLFTVRPGITGLWQVSGRSDVSYDERVRFDMNYIRHWTIWLDIYIILRTIPAVLKSRGAY